MLVDALQSKPFFILDFKSDSTDPGTGATPFSFTSLVAQDTTILLTGAANITAHATGDGLTFTWTEENGYGTFIPNGSNPANVQWTICHAARFKIICEAKDKYNHSESKYVYISSRE